MQKKIIALAVAGLLSGAAFAQSNVTIYGKVRVSVDNIDRNTTAGDNWAVQDQSSRIGFKGEEKLSGGMSAIWQWESALNNTNGANTTTIPTALPATAATTANWTQRNTFLGLKGGFGTVLAGTHDTPYKLGSCADLFGDTTADACGGTTALTTNTNSIIGRNGWDNRLSNVLAYISPTWSGFHFAVGLVSGESPTDTVPATDADGLAEAQSYVAVYQNGPLKVTLGHELATKEAVAALSGGAANNEKHKATKFNIAYKIGAIGLGYTYEQSTAGPTVNLGAGSPEKDKGHLLSASYAMGATTLGLQIGKFDDQGTLSGAANADNDVSNWTLGAYHALSKRTQAYVAYHDGKVKNGIAAGSDIKTKVFTMGLNHDF